MSANRAKLNSKFTPLLPPKQNRQKFSPLNVVQKFFLTRQKNCSNRCISLPKLLKIYHLTKWIKCRLCHLFNVAALACAHNLSLSVLTLPSIPVTKGTSLLAPPLIPTQVIQSKGHNKMVQRLPEIVTSSLIKGTDYVQCNTELWTALLFPNKHCTMVTG